MALVTAVYCIISLFMAARHLIRYLRWKAHPAVVGVPTRIMSEVPVYQDKKQTKLQSVSREYEVMVQSASGALAYRLSEVCGPDGRSTVVMGQPREYRLDETNGKLIDTETIMKQVQAHLVVAGVCAAATIALLLLVSLIK